MKRKQNFGVAIGPANPGDKTIFDLVIEANDESPDQYKVKEYDNYNFISVLCPSIDHAKKLANTRYEGNIKVAMVNIEEIDEIAEKLWPAFPSLINTSRKSISFCRANTKFKINFHYAPNLSTVIFLALMYSIQNNITIERFNFSNCEINKENGFTNFHLLFPKIKEINLSSNPVVINDLDYYFGSAKVITDNPIDEEFLVSNKRHQSDFTPVSNDEEIFEQPHLIFPNYYNERNKTLEMFQPINIDVDQFPTNGFIGHFFKLMWDSILECENYYSDDAVFSIFTDKSENLANFAEFSSDYQNGNIRHYYGKSVVQILNQIFPFGFKSVLTLMDCSVVSDNLFSVVAHGVFEGNENIIFGFDRSFLIVFADFNYRIINDNIFVREVPNTY